MLEPVGDHGTHDTVRRSYDTVAENYATDLRDELRGKPLDRALLSSLIEQTESGKPIADLGCGPGHIAAWLADHGATTVGIDLSAAMVALGRKHYSAVEFRAGDLLELPAADGEFGAAVAFYSIIHLAPGELRSAFEQVHRVLRPSGLFLVSFHIGSEIRHFDTWWGHEVDVDFRFFDPDQIIADLAAAGFEVRMRMERPNYPHEVDTRRAYLLARRADPASQQDLSRVRAAARSA
ncbi:class I SAM-dependent DNA methyltransferase [Nocardia sp. NBC_01009]|uniref:class I SAM-dependent DNA methyltransferase n=1 Tax=Nocardia sp. NBC_01009 TaxID=2975996 RepID=UPI0038671A0D|nr:class I SAM-dependent methyltransferase [Nocardia sp. NBC_01009]